MTKILFVCHGNICRSPMAEFVMKDLVEKAGLKDSFSISSAATSTEEIGNDMHWGTKDKLSKAEISFTHRRARQMTRMDYEMYDYLIGMDDANIRNMKDISKGDPDNKIYALLDFTNRAGEIADPWYTGDFDETFDDILEGCQGLLKHINTTM